MDELSEFQDLTEKLREEIEQQGLYLLGCHVQTTADPESEGKSVRDLMDDGEEFMIHAHFQIGDVAYLPRIQHPEEHDEDVAFRNAAPTEVEMMVERIREEGRSGRLSDLGEEQDGQDQAGQ